MKIGRIKIEVKAQRWPWQDGYNWRGMVSSSAPLNAGGARFGGGWSYKLGIDIGGPGSFILNLLFGIVRVNIFDWVEAEKREVEYQRKKAEIFARIDARKASPSYDPECGF